MSYPGPDQAMNAILDQTLTNYGQHIVAQVRDTVTLSGGNDTTVIIHHPNGAPRSAEDGHPHYTRAGDARLLRDVLNAATDRGLL